MKVIKGKHVGCYGIAYNQLGEVLLIKKARGPYKGTLDLPGGGIEEKETAEETLKREFLEETGLHIAEYNLREIVTNYVTWKINDTHTENLQHIAIIYNVKVSASEMAKTKNTADGLDSLGADWYKIEDLKKSDLSPLAQVIKTRK